MNKTRSRQDRDLASLFDAVPDRADDITWPRYVLRVGKRPDGETPKVCRVSSEIFSKKTPPAASAAAKAGARFILAQPKYCNVLRSNFAHG
jgi:hypothetical protein